jgi:hypothetical protein
MSGFIFRNLILIFLISGFAHAKPEVSGKIYPFYSSGFAKNLDVHGVGAQISVLAKPKDSLRIHLEGLGEHDAGPSKESYGELSNAFLEWRSEFFQLRVGWQTVQWEGTDILNLADVVNSKNYMRPLNPIPRSSLTVRLTHEIEEWELDFIYIPKKVNHRYPGNKSYWLPRNKRIVLENENTEVIVPQEIEYELNPSDVLNSADKNNIGTRINYRGSFADLSLFFFEGGNVSGTMMLEGVPLEVSPATVIQLTSPVKITPVEYRQRVAGGMITKPFLESWLFRISASNTKPIGLDERIPSPQDSFVTSLELSTEILRKPAVFSVGAYEVRKGDSNQVALLRSIFAKAYSLAGRLELTEESSGLWGLVYDSIGKSSLFHLEWDQRFSGHLSFGVSLDVFSGANETLLGSYNDFDFYRTSLKYSF